MSLGGLWQVSCDCVIGTSAFMSPQQNTTKRQRKESGMEANLTIATRQKRTTPTLRLLKKERWMLMLVRMWEKQKITPQTQIQQQQTQGSGQRQETADTTQIACVNKETANLNNPNNLTETDELAICYLSNWQFQPRVEALSLWQGAKTPFHWRVLYCTAVLSFFISTLLYRAPNIELKPLPVTRNVKKKYFKKKICAKTPSIDEYFTTPLCRDL